MRGSLVRDELWLCWDMKTEYIEDLVFGERLLISESADKTELDDNIRCARTLLLISPI